MTIQINDENFIVLTTAALCFWITGTIYFISGTITFRRVHDQIKKEQKEIDDSENWKNG